MSATKSVGKLRLREGSRVSKSIIIRPGKVEKVTVKSAIPIVGAFSSAEVEVKHSDLVDKEFGAPFHLRDSITNRIVTFTLEPSPLLDAARRRLSHYVDNAFFAVLGLGLFGLGIWVFALFIEYIWIPLYRALRGTAGTVADGVLSSRFASALVGLALLAVSVVAIGFLLAIGWRLADKVRRRG